MENKVESKTFYEQPWFAWVCLVLFAPVGIFLLWKYSHYAKQPTIILSVVFGMFFMVVLVSGMGEETAEGSDGNNNELEESSKEEIPEEESSQEEPAEEKSTEPEEDDDNEPDLKDLASVEISDDITIEDNTIHVQGDSNLENGAVISYEVENLNNVDNWKEGTAEVIDGAFSEKVDIADFSDGEIRVWIAFSPNAQPDKIIEQFQVDDDDWVNYPYTNEALFVKSEPLKLSGAGDTATEFFSLTEGFAVFDMDHTGDRNFIIELKDESGQTVELLVNQIGNYQGKTFALIPSAGDYLLDVTADGNWNGTITQSIPDKVASDPGTIEGTGDDVVFMEMESGMKRFELSHDGERNFIVTVNGSALLANEIGNYEGSTTETIQDDAIYVFAINADGNWKIAVE